MRGKSSPSSSDPKKQTRSRPATLTALYVNFQAHSDRREATNDHSFTGSPTQLQGADQSGGRNARATSCACAHSGVPRRLTLESHRLLSVLPQSSAGSGTLTFSLDILSANPPLPGNTKTSHPCAEPVDVLTSLWNIVENYPRPTSGQRLWARTQLALSEVEGSAEPARPALASGWRSASSAAIVPNKRNRDFSPCGRFAAAKRRRKVAQLAELSEGAQAVGL
jgi:hypothetical protein